MEQGNNLKPMLPNHLMTSPAFFIEKQESLVTEKFSKNGRIMDLHLVAKNVAFNINIASLFDLNLSPPTARLIYDIDDESHEEKEVEQLKTPPLEIITHVDKSGHRAVVEAKISVLSSQHERAYFRIKFVVLDPTTHQNLVEYSQPIKVIAKRNQIRKMLERKLQTQVKNEQGMVTTPVGQINLAQLAPKRDRATMMGESSAIQESLHRIEELQREQLKMIKEMNTKTQKLVATPVEPIDFETAFKQFLTSWSKISSDERPTKIRKVVPLLDKNQSEQFEEFLKSVNIETKQPELEGIGDSGYDMCSEACKQCPHKQELEIINSFYQDFLKDPSSPEIA